MTAWTRIPTLFEEVAELWKTQSATEIAQTLNDKYACEALELTRSMVLGRIHRWGLPKDHNGLANHVPKVPVRVDKPKKAFVFYQRPAEPNVKQVGYTDAGTAVAALERTQCRYIYGDVQYEICYCTKRKWALNYCREHYKLTHETYVGRTA